MTGLFFLVSLLACLYGSSLVCSLFERGEERAETRRQAELLASARVVRGPFTGRKR